MPPRAGSSVQNPAFARRKSDILEMPTLPERFEALSRVHATKRTVPSTDVEPHTAALSPVIVQGPRVGLEWLGRRRALQPTPERPNHWVGHLLTASRLTSRLSGPLEGFVGRDEPTTRDLRGARITRLA